MKTLQERFETHLADKASARWSMEALIEDADTGELSDGAMAEDARNEDRNDAMEEVAVAVRDAEEAEDQARSMRDTAEGLAEIRDTADAVNTQSGFTLESFYFAKLALDSYIKPIGRKLPLACPALESLKPTTRFKVSLEDVDALVADATGAADAMEKCSVEAAVKALGLLCEARGEVNERVASLLSVLSSATYDETKSIQVDPAVEAALSVGGTIPAALGSYLTDYSQTVQKILSIYVEAAQESARKGAEFATLYQGLMANMSPLNFLVDRIKGVNDPRQAIDKDALLFALPGSGQLFGFPAPSATGVDEKPDETVDQVTVIVNRFCSDMVPLAPTLWNERHDEGASQGEVRVICKEAAIKGLTAIQEALNAFVPKAYAEAHLDLWSRLRSAYAGYVESTNTLNQSNEVSFANDKVREFLDMVYELAVWPLVHVVTNLICVSNAFVLFVERSVSGESAEVKPETPAPADASDSATDEPTQPDGDQANDDDNNDGADVDALSYKKVDEDEEEETK